VDLPKKNYFKKAISIGTRTPKKARIKDKISYLLISETSKNCEKFFYKLPAKHSEIGFKPHLSRQKPHGKASRDDLS
jgi:hypothetical protein